MKYGVRLETHNENDSGWLFFTESEVHNITAENFGYVKYNDVVESIHHLFEYVYLFPVGTKIRFAFIGDKVYMVDVFTGKNIDYMKYATLEEGSPLSDAIDPKSGLWARLLGR